MTLKEEIQKHFGDDFAPFFNRFLPELKPGGAGNLKALCPFHEDGNASLSINAKDGRWNCKACGAKGDAFTFYAKKHNLDARASFKEVLAGIAEAFGISNGKGEVRQNRRVVKYYDYHDQAGNVVFQKIRYEPKGFGLRRPDGAGGWIHDMAGVGPELYRLPEVLADSYVWIVEGEKDADNLAALGITATTNFDGAGKWRASYTEALSGKNVLIVPDNDEPGRRHAELVAAALHGRAASVSVVELPGLQTTGADVSDFIEAAGDPLRAAEQLVELAEGARPYDKQARERQLAGVKADLPANLPEPTKGKARGTLLMANLPEATKGAARDQAGKALGFRFIHGGDILKNLKPAEWRVHDILIEKSFYYNFGDSGHFKTFVELDRCLCIATGLDYHGHKVKQGTVFYIAGEGQQGIGRRLAAWHAAHGTKGAEVPFFVSETATQLMDAGAVDEVRRAIDCMTAEYGPPALVCIDTLARNFGEGDENATKDMNRCISNMDASFRNDFLRSLNHHTGLANKERARGSYALHCAADAAFRVALTAGGQVLVECLKMKDAKPAPAMLFDTREVLLDIEGVPDRSYVLELAAEGPEAVERARSAQIPAAAGKVGEALDILRGLYAACRCNLEASGRPDSAPHVTVKTWQSECFKKGLFGARAFNFNRAAANLLEKGLIRYDTPGVHAYPIELFEQL